MIIKKDKVLLDLFHKYKELNNERDFIESLKKYVIKKNSK